LRSENEKIIGDDQDASFGSGDSLQSYQHWSKLRRVFTLQFMFFFCVSFLVGHILFFVKREG